MSVTTAEQSVDWRQPVELVRLGTPCYVFEPGRVLAEYASLKAALGTALTVSLKANPNPDLFVRCAHAFDDGVELASIGELNTVVGRSTVAKFVNTPAMDADLMAAALASRATLVLDSPQQVEMFYSLQCRAAKSPVVLRLSAAALAGNPAGIGPGDHFGMDPQDALAAIGHLGALGHRVRGLHVFAGSNTFDTWSPLLATAMERLLPAVEVALGAPPEMINLGGGFPEDWRAHPQAFERYRHLLRGLAGKTRIYHEAGRAVFALAGRFVTQVLALKSVNGRAIAVCDGGLAQCFRLAQTERVIKRLARPHVVRMSEAAATTLSSPLRIVGNTCSRADVIGELAPGTAIAPGDRLIFNGCGAYSTYSPVSFLSLRAPQTYLIS